MVDSLYPSWWSWDRVPPGALRSLSRSARVAAAIAGPSAPAGFWTAGGRRTLLRSPGLGCVPHPDLGWRFRGARLGGRAVGPVLDGDRPQSLPFAAGGGTTMGGGRWLAGGQRVGEITITCCMRRVRSNPHTRGPIAGPAQSHHNMTSQCTSRHVSPCPPSPTNRLNYPLIPTITTHGQSRSTTASGGRIFAVS